MSKSIVQNSFEFSPDFKKELSALKKANQIGKKLSSTSKYIMYDNMLFAYDDENPHYSIAFLKDKIIEQLVLLSNHIIEINGAELYSALSENVFVGYEELTNRLSLLFRGIEVIKEEFNIDRFSNYAVKHGQTDYDVILAYKKGWETNMQIYNLYLKFMDNLEEKKIEVSKPFDLKYTNEENEIFDKTRHIMNKIKKSVLLCRKDFNSDELSKFLDTDLPTDFSLICSDGNKHFVRLMKNMFPTISSSSTLAFSLFTSNNESLLYLVTEVDNSDAVVTNIFKIYNIID